MGCAAQDSTRIPASATPTPDTTEVPSAVAGSSAASSSTNSLPTSTTAANPDPPRVWAPPPIPDDAPPATGLAAQISGTVRYDETNDCFLIDDPWGATYPVVWPAGTIAAATGNGVVLSDGRTVKTGDHVSGGGGYLRVAPEWAIPAECSNLSDGEIAVFNAASPLDI